MRPVIWLAAANVVVLFVALPLVLILSMRGQSVPAFVLLNVVLVVGSGLTVSAVWLAIRYARRESDE